jgi:hypothetical protein
MAVSDERRAVAASAADAYKKMLAENPDIAAQLDGFRAAGEADRAAARRAGPDNPGAVSRLDG